jgi:hypothetical protein
MEVGLYIFHADYMPRTSYFIRIINDKIIEEFFGFK